MLLENGQFYKSVRNGELVELLFVSKWVVKVKIYPRHPSAKPYQEIMDAPTFDNWFTGKMWYLWNKAPRILRIFGVKYIPEKFLFFRK